VTRTAFAQRASADPLRIHARWSGAVLAASLLVPHETIDGRAVYLWRLLPEMTAGLRLAALAPIVAGVGVLVASFACRRATSLATVVAGATAGAVVTTWAATLTVGQQWTGSRGAPAIVVLALAAAAMHQRHASTAEQSRPSPKRARRGWYLLLGAATVLAAVHHWASPWFDETAVASLARLAGRVALRPTVGQVATCLLIAPFALWPWVAILLGWVDALRAGVRRRPLAAVVLFHTAPALLEPAISRTLAGAPGDAGVSLLGEVMVLAAASTLLAHACASLLRTHAADPAGLETESTTDRRVAFGVAGTVVTAMAVSCALARSRPPELAWRLGEGGAEAELLYATHIPAWSDGKGSSSEVIVAARAVDARLAATLELLTRAAERDDVTPRRWDQLVAGVNDAARRATLPYYLESGEIVVRGGGGASRSFRLDTRRILRVRRFRADDRTESALHVRSTRPDRARLHALGSVRDTDPFAMVTLDAIDAYARELELGASVEPVACIRGQAQVPVDAGALRRCGALLEQLRSTSTLAAELTSTVERHELQHRIDGAQLERAVVVTRRLALHDIDVQRRDNRELSAYLAQMTSSDPGAHLTLVRLLRLAALDHSGTERRVALLAFEALVGRELELGDDAFGAAFAELAALEPEALRRRAAAAWETQYGRRLAHVEPID
jgi:hypothetical protein